MPEENIELVRRWYATFPDLGDTDPAEDRETFDRIFPDYLDGAFELRLPGDYPEGEHVFSGEEGLGRYVAMLRDTWSEWRLEPERFLDAGDRVVVFLRIVAKGKAGGVPIEQTTTAVVLVRDGRLISGQVYRHRSEALADVGLDE